MSNEQVSAAAAAAYSFSTTRAASEHRHTDTQSQTRSIIGAGRLQNVMLSRISSSRRRRRLTAFRLSTKATNTTTTISHHNRSITSHYLVYIVAVVVDDKARTESEGRPAPVAVRSADVDDHPSLSLSPSLFCSRSPSVRLSLLIHHQFLEQ